MKLKLKQTIIIGFAFLGICLLWETYSALMPLFLRDFISSKSVIGFIMSLDNIAALILLPLMGLVSDRFSSRFGRRIPFIAVGSILAAFSLLAINLAHNEEMLWLMILSACLMIVFMCLYRTPAVSLMPDVTPKPLRSNGNVVINIMGLLGGVTFLVLTMVGSLYSAEKNDLGEATRISGDSWALVGIVAALMILSTVVLVAFTRENQLVKKREEDEQALGILDDDTLDIEDLNEDAPPKLKGGLKGMLTSLKQNFSGLSKGQRTSLIFLLSSVVLWFFAYDAAKTWFSTVAYELLGTGNFSTPLLVGNVAGFAMYVPSALIAKKIGRRNTILCGLGMMALGFLLASIFVFTVHNESLFNLLFMGVFVFIGAGWATLNVHSYVMAVEMATKKNTGFFTGLYYVFSMGSQALTATVSGLAIEHLGMKALFPYTLIFTCLAIITMLFVKHGNVKAEHAQAISKAHEQEA